MAVLRGLRADRRLRRGGAVLSCECYVRMLYIITFARQQCLFARPPMAAWPCRAHRAARPPAPQPAYDVDIWT